MSASKFSSIVQLVRNLADLDVYALKKRCLPGTSGNFPLLYLLKRLIEEKIAGSNNARISIIIF